MEAPEHEEDIAFRLAMKRHYCDLRQRDVEDSLFVSMMNWEYGCLGRVQMEAPEHEEDKLTKISHSAIVKTIPLGLLPKK